MKKVLVSILLFSAFFLQPRIVSATVPVDPQYIILNIAPRNVNGPGVQGCCFWFPQDAGDIPAAFNEVTTTFSSDTINRRVGIGFILEYMDNNYPGGTILQNDAGTGILDLSLSKKVPVLIKLDSFFWNTREDLWYWWDPSISEGDSNRRKNNVEWAGWEANTATKISWFNWGSQGRLTPPPNFGSAEYILEKQKKLIPLLNIIVGWYNSLLPDQKYLLAGVVLDGELSIGINGYYYPNGNYYLENYPSDASHDPTYGLDFSKGSSGGLTQLGYAAAIAYGIKSSGTLTIDDLNAIIKRHAAMLSKTALDSGVPFEKIFVHGGGNFSVNPTQTFSYDNVVTNFGKPGWSFYDQAGNPANAPGLLSALDQLDNTPWAAVEWNNYSSYSWKDALVNTLSYKSNKLLAIYNWSGIKNNTVAINAIRDVLDTPSSCWLSPAVINSQVAGNNVTLSWGKPENTEALYLGISNNPERLPSGGIKEINVANEIATDKTTVSKTLAKGTYYWQITADGCGASQRRIAYGTFSVPSIVRPAYCQSAVISGSQLFPGGFLNITSTANTSNIQTFSYLFFNLDNPYSPGNPKPISFEQNTNFTKTVTRENPTDTASITVSFGELDKPDLNWNSQKPRRIQVNAYFTDLQGNFSQADPNCVVQFEKELPGDLNADGHVDILDLRQLLSTFTTIFDYNLVVGNFGK